MICPAYISATRCAPCRRDRQVVRDQQQAMLRSRCRSFKQVEDLRLDGHVERVVGSSATRKSGSAASVIAIITRCFCRRTHAERVLVDAPLGLRDADPAQPVDGLGARPAPARGGVRLDRRRSGRPTASPGSGWWTAPGRSCRCAAAHARMASSGRSSMSSPPQQPGGDAAVLGQQAHQRQRGHALAAAARPTSAKVSPRWMVSRMASSAADAGIGVLSSTDAPAFRPSAASPGRRAQPLARRMRGNRARAGRRRHARRRQTGWPPAPCHHEPKPRRSSTTPPGRGSSRCAPG